jgi:hypothetical protein
MFRSTRPCAATRPGPGGRVQPCRYAGWYHELDLLPGGIEQIIPATISLDDTVRQIMRDAGLASHQQPHITAGPSQAHRAQNAPH